MKTLATLAILSRLAEPTTRSQVAKELAAAVGARDMLLLVRDVELDVLLPARGFPQSLQPASVWRPVLAACRERGTHEGHLEWPSEGDVAPYEAHVCPDGTTMLLLGGPPRREDLEPLLIVLPLLSTALRAEQAAAAAAGEVRVAREMSRHASELAVSLDAARADLQRALEETATLNVRLREADARKDEFLAMLGHELRNPLAAISSALMLMRVDEVQSHVRARAETVIDNQTAQLTRLVDDLLDVARVSRGKITLKRIRVDLSEVARRALDVAQPLIRTKGHQVEFRPTPGLYVRVDPARVEQMLSNLLTNAAKYTDPGGTIVLETRCSDEGALVVVRDSGIGIAPEMLERIFDAFVQISPPSDRSAGGLGIGLTLVRQLAELHGGTVRASSDVGSGSEFVLVLPELAPAPDEPQGETP